MSIKKQIEVKLNQTLKDKDKSSYPTLRLIVSAIKDAEIANRSKENKQLTDSDVVSILKKMIKQRNESCEIYKKASRQELLDTETKEINIISRETEERDVIRHRHVIDSAQIIEFIDLNSKFTTDIGSGGGFPGIITSIMLKNKKEKSKIHLYEKSFHKSNFLREVSRKLNLKTEIFQKNIFDIKKLKTGTIMSRAFKPMPEVLNLVNENFSRYKNLVFFMGKNGKKIFEKSKREWDLEYIEKQSLTSKDSFLLNIKKIKKKN